MCMFHAAAALWKRFEKTQVCMIKAILIGYQRHVVVNLLPLSVLLPLVPIPSIYFAPSHDYSPDLSSFTPYIEPSSPPMGPLIPRLQPCTLLTGIYIYFESPHTSFRRFVRHYCIGDDVDNRSHSHTLSRECLAETDSYPRWHEKGSGGDCLGRCKNS